MRRHLSSQRGTVAIETVMVIPILMLALVFILDQARVWGPAIAQTQTLRTLTWRVLRDGAMADTLLDVARAGAPDATVDVALTTDDAAAPSSAADDLLIPAELTRWPVRRVRLQARWDRVLRGAPDARADLTGAIVTDPGFGPRNAPSITSLLGLW